MAARVQLWALDLLPEQPGGVPDGAAVRDAAIRDVSRDTPGNVVERQIMQISSRVVRDQFFPLCPGEAGDAGWP